MARKFLVYYALITLLAAMIACSDDTPPTPTETKSDLVRIQRVVDFENAGNASDLIVQFLIEEPQNIDELRLIVAPISSFSVLQNDNERVAALTSDKYDVIPLSGDTYEVTPDPGLVDVDGAAITNGVSYRLGFITVKDGVARLDKNSIGFELNNEHYLTGRYQGTWDDNIYTAFGISADLRFVGGKISGAFYYTSNFVACCGGADDGEISFTLDGAKIVDFEYDQWLPNFMGGCEGLYSGDGQVADFVTLNINFEGNDCEGPHTGGKIRLEKL